MGLDSLSDNIISDKFPGEYEELFDANEFLDLNEYTDPDTGLNLQASKAYANA